MNLKKRLDLLLVERGIAESRARAQAIIAAGQIRVNGRVLDKAGHLIPVDATIELLTNPCPYVSRGGLKLAHALSHFQIDVTGRVCMDVGASTGGFTDCLLQHGAKLVYAVDVGYGQLDWRLRNDSRVISLEKQNIRYLDRSLIQEPVDLLVMDVSFISLKTALPPALPFLKENGEIVALIKPQFEAGKKKVGKGGIVRDEDVRNEVIKDLQNFFSNELRLCILGVVTSPIYGAKGNEEYLIHMKNTIKQKIKGGVNENGGEEIELEGDRQTQR